MKARIKETGQIVDVFPTEAPMGNSSMTYYTENVESNVFYHEEALDFNDVIDWEQRFYEVAKDLFTHQNFYPENAIARADEFIEMLKKHHSNGRDKVQD